MLFLDFFLAFYMESNYNQYENHFQIGSEKMRTTYHTKQKEKLWALIQKKKDAFTIKDIFDEMKEDMGLTTIYRYVEKLEKNGILTKTLGENNTTYYQYLEQCQEENHFYLKCSQCGTMIHVDCDFVKKLENHILKEHKFTINKDHIIMTGLCEECQNQ